MGFIAGLEGILTGHSQDDFRALGKGVLNHYFSAFELLKSKANSPPNETTTAEFA
jgi:hypothetical protein